MFTPNVEFKPARPEDVQALLKRGIRESDRLEIWRVGGRKLPETLERSVELSKQTGVAGSVFVNGEIVCMFGVGSFRREDGSLIGVPWLLANKDVERPETSMIMGRKSRKFIDCWQKAFGRLENIADPANKKANAYLSWLGFKFDYNNPLRGPFGHELLRFWR